MPSTEDYLTLQELDTLTPGETFTVRASIHRASDAPQVKLVASGVDSTAITATGWTEVTVTSTATGTDNIRLVPLTNAGGRVSVDRLLVEEGPTAPPYFDGSFPVGGDFSHSWTGTPNASTSTQSGVPTVGWTATDCSTYNSWTEAFSGDGSLAVFFPYSIGSVRRDYTGTANQSYTWSAYVKAPSGATFDIEIEERTATDNVQTVFTTFTGTGNWERVNQTITFGATGELVRVKIVNDSAQGATLYIDSELFEPTSTMLDYFDGSNVSSNSDLTVSWAGTPNASTSSLAGVGVSEWGTGSLGREASYLSSEWWRTGTKSIRITPTGTSTATRATSSPISGIVSGNSYTIVGYIRIASPQTGTLNAFARTLRVSGDATVVSSPQAPNTVGVHEVRTSFTATGTTVSVEAYNGASVGNGDIWWDDLMVVQGSYSGTYFDGNTADGNGYDFEWTGTPITSTSTATLTELYATNVIKNPAMNTIASGAVTLRSNLSTNPSAETNITGFSALFAGTGSALVQSTEEAFIGTFSAKFTYGIGVGIVDAGLLIDTRTASNGEHYTASAYVYAEEVINNGLRLIAYGSGALASTVRGTSTTIIGEWARISLTAQATGNGTLNFAVCQSGTGTNPSGKVFFVDAVLIEQTDQLRDYFDGGTTDSFGWDYAWSGTTGSSVSTASAQAVVLRTNLVPNPSVEVNSTGWALTGSGTLSRVSSESYIGSNSLERVAAVIDDSVDTDFITVISSTTYTASVWLKGEVGKLVRIDLSEFTSGDVLVGQTAGVVATATGSWQRLSVTGTFGTTGVKAKLIVRNRNNTAHTFYIDNALLERGTTLRNYFDGQFPLITGESYSGTWTGTAHASTSVHYVPAVAGWQLTAGAGATTFAYQGTEPDGDKYLRISRPSGDSATTSRVLRYSDGSPFDGFTAGTPVTVILRARASQSTTLSIGIKTSAGQPVGQTLTSTAIGTNWTEIRQTIAVSNEFTSGLGVYIDIPSLTLPGFVDVSDSLAVIGHYVGPYFTGAISPDVDSTVSWSGTVGNSTSDLNVRLVENWVGTFGSTVHRTQEQQKTGPYSAKVLCDGLNPLQGFKMTSAQPVSPSRTYTASAWVYASPGKTLRISLEELSESQALLGTTNSANITATGSWQRISVSRTLSAGAARANVVVSNVASVEHIFYVDDTLLEGSPTLQNYFDGSTSNSGDYSYIWSGTPNNSFSVQRAPLPSGVLSSSESSTVQSSEWFSAGTRSIKISPNTLSNDTYANIAGMLPAPSTLAGKVCTILGQVRIPQELTGALNSNALAFQLITNVSTGGTNTIPLTYRSTATNTAGQYVVRATFLVPDTATTWDSVRLYGGASAGNGEVWWDDVLLAEGTYLSPFFSGDSSDSQDFTFSWTGAPNLSTSTSAINPARDWTGIYGATVYRTATEKYAGTYSAQVLCTGAVGLQGIRLISRATVSPSLRYYASAWVKGGAGKTLRIELQEWTANGTFIGSTLGSNVVATGAWQRISVTRVTSANGGTADVIVSNVSAVSHTFFVDRVMLEASNTLQDYFDGFFPGVDDFSYTWTGTPDASTSQFQAPSVNKVVPTDAYAIQSSLWSSAGANSTRIISTATTTGSAYVDLASMVTAGLEPGKTYTALLTARRAQIGTQTATLSYEGYISSSLAEQIQNSVPTGVGVHNVAITFTVSASVEDAKLRFYSNQASGSPDLWFDGLLIVEGEYVGDYFDGDTDSTIGAFPVLYQWDGVPHDSDSIRDVGGAIPTGGAEIPEPYGEAERVNTTASLQIRYRSGWLG